MNAAAYMNTAGAELPPRWRTITTTLRLRREQAGGRDDIPFDWRA